MQFKYDFHEAPAMRGLVTCHFLLVYNQPTLMILFSLPLPLTHPLFPTTFRT